MWRRALRAALLIVTVAAHLPAVADERPRPRVETTDATRAPEAGAIGSAVEPVMRPSATAAPSPMEGMPTGRAAGDASGAPRRWAGSPRPSEFQKFVEAATGRLLPIFGADFFAATAPEAGAAPVDNVPVTADYVVGPGDEIVVRAWGSIDVDYRASVDRNGQINLPKVGSFTVAGIRAADLERQLRAQIDRLYTNFNLSVSLGHLRALKVFVVGSAQRPGVYTLPSQATLLSAVAAAGGPGPNGSMRRITLHRDGRVISELDVYDFLGQGDKSKDVQLAGGDVVVIRPAGPRVALAGALDNAAIYELRSREEPLRDVLRYAGGAPVLASPNRAQLERVDPSQPRAVRSVDAFPLDAAGLIKLLRDGDVLTLLAISPEFASAVTLKGHVAQPLRYPYKPGMRIRDLIPDKDALITSDYYRRKNLLVQVIEPDDEALTPYERQRALDRERRTSSASASAGLVSTARDAPGSGRSALPRPAPTALFESINWNHAVIERLNRVELKTEFLSFHLGRAVLQDDPAENVELQPGDVVTVYGQRDFRMPVASQTRLVSLEGEVGAPGVYQLLPGETMRQLLARAGGLTPQAYVYGLDFSREETRRQQRENLASAIARVEALTATQAVRDAASRRADPDAAIGAAVSSAVAQAQLARLSRIEPTGRVALELDPAVDTIDGLPDVVLENADRIRVPPRPDVVNVVGAVVNTNGLLWKPGNTVADYLKLATLDETAADPSNLFILRADGTVRSANDRGNGVFGRRAIESEVLQPGDSLVVPSRVDFESWGRALVRNLKDLAQIFRLFGVSAVAIKQLKATTTTTTTSTTTTSSP